MTDSTDPHEPALPSVPAEAKAETLPPPAPPRRPRRQRNLVPWLYAAGFLVLAAALVWVWQNPQGVQRDDGAVAALQQQIQALQARVARLEQRPAAAATDLGPLQTRIDGLEKRLNDNGNSQLAARIAVLEQKAGGDIQLANRVDTIASRLDGLAERDQSAANALNQRIESDEARINAVEQASSQVTAVATKAGLLARLQAAQAALNAGKPLGDIPGAPAALTRYATGAPPTEASLRLAYPSAERAALEASQPDPQDAPFLDRVWGRVQDLATVRQGDHVIVGNPSAGPLAKARAALSAGDIAGAVQAVSELTGAPAKAMADWLAQAKALLAARAALADMAARS